MLGLRLMITGHKDCAHYAADLNDLGLEMFSNNQRMRGILFPRYDGDGRTLLIRGLLLSVGCKVWPLNRLEQLQCRGYSGYNL